MKRFINVILFFLMACVAMSAQEHVSDSLEIFFYQGKSYWAPNFKENDKRLKEFVERFRQLRENQIMSKISKIHIISGASPEGPWALNQRLSSNRAKCVQGVLKQYIDLPDSVVVVDSRGVNWQGLYELVEVSDMQYRDEVLDIITNTPELDQSRGYNYELRKKTLEKLHGGVPYQYMYRNFFPSLRSFYLRIGIEWERYEAAKQETIAEGLLVENLSTPPNFT